MLKEKLEEYNKTISVTNKSRKKIVEAAFKEVCDDLFSTYPKLSYFVFRAYTPHFNDGDPCRYSSGHTWPDINMDEEDEEMYDEDGNYKDKEIFLPEYGSPDYKEYEEITAAVRAGMALFTDDDIDDMFGDGVRVKVTRDGAEVEEYEHY